MLTLFNQMFDFVPYTDVTDRHGITWKEHKAVG